MLPAQVFRKCCKDCQRRDACLLIYSSVAVCCSVLQCVAVYCKPSATWLVPAYIVVLQGVAVCCSVLQCVAVCCRVLQTISNVTGACYTFVHSMCPDIFSIAFIHRKHYCILHVRILKFLGGFVPAVHCHCCAQHHPPRCLRASKLRARRRRLRAQLPFPAALWSRACLFHNAKILKSQSCRHCT